MTTSSVFNAEQQLRAGRRCWSETEEEVRAFMRDFAEAPAPQADAA